MALCSAAAVADLTSVHYLRIPCLRWTPHPAIVTTRDNGDCIRVLLVPVCHYYRVGGTPDLFLGYLTLCLVCLVCKEKVPGRRVGYRGLQKPLGAKNPLTQGQFQVGSYQVGTPI